MVADPIFWQSLTNNLWYALGTIPVSIALALLMAVWVNDRIAGRALVRMAYFTPTVLPMIAVANIWLFFYTPQYGLLEQVLGAFGVPAHNWLGSPDTALACVIVVTIWKEAGFFMIFYLAALQQISPVLAEAASDDPVRPRQCGDQRVSHRRPYHRHDPWRAGQRDVAALVLHLRGRLQVLGFRLCGSIDSRAARFARRCRARAIRLSRAPGALPMTARAPSIPYQPRGFGLALETAGAWLLALIWLLPLLYAFWTAFHPSAYATRFDLTAPLTLENFVAAWNAAPFARYFLNTFALVTLILACQFVLCTLAAYAFARFEFKGRDVAFLLVLLQLMIMPDVLIVENYRTMGHLGILDSIPAIALPYVASAFGIFLMRQTFKAVPRELDDAARVEGAGPLQILLKVYVPLARPIYIAYGLVSVSYHWNNFLWPLIVTNSVEARPLTVGLQVFSSTDQGVDWSIICAATLMTSAPLLIGFLLFQRQFVQSFMRAGIR
jgi:sn-glycerol 3-phosphate transport system permease protein